MESSDDFNAQNYLFPLIQQWIDEISFFSAGELSKNDKGMDVWKNIEKVLATLEQPLIKLLLVKQSHLVDIILRHVTPSIYSSNPELWYLATRCWSHCYAACGAFIWEATDLSPADLTACLFDTLELTLRNTPQGTGNLSHAIYAVEVTSVLVTNNELFFVDTFTTFVHYFSELLFRVDEPTTQRKLLSFVQKYMFSLANSARCTLEDVRCLSLSGSGELSSEGVQTLPLGGSKQLLTMLCAHPTICSHPSIVLVVVRCHAALCSIPFATSVPLHRQNVSQVVQRAILGFSDQVTIMGSFLEQVHLWVASKKLSLLTPASLHNDLISVCAALVCAQSTAVSTAARQLLQTLVTTDALQKSRIDHFGAPIPIRTIFSTPICIAKFGVVFLDGLLKVTTDQLEVNLMDDDAESKAMCSNVDEVIECLLEYVVMRTVVYDTTIGDIAKKMSEVLIVVSRQKRPKLASTLCTLLVKGSNCSVRGCVQLLEANKRFVGNVAVGSSTSSSGASSVAKMSGYMHHSVAAPSVAKSNTIDRLDGSLPASKHAWREIVDLSTSPDAANYMNSKHSALPAYPAAAPNTNTAAVANHTGASLTKRPDDWSFLKPPVKPAPKNPLAQLDNSISRAEIAAGRKGESTLDRLDRIEREQIAQEKRNLIRKRMYGDMGVESGNGLIDSEDYPTVSNKYRKTGVSASGDTDGNWLSARQATVVKEKEEDNWQAQLRELKEVKARAREQTERQRLEQQQQNQYQQYPSVASVTLVGNANEPTASRDRSTDGGSSGARRSSILQQDQAFEDEDEEGAGGGMQRGARRVANWREFLAIPASNKSSSGGRTVEDNKLGGTDAVNISNMMQMYLAQQQNQGSSHLRAQRLPTIAESMAEISIDPLIRKLLKCSLLEISADVRGSGGSSATGGGNADDNVKLEDVPVRFMHEEHYIGIFQPLLLEEVKSALASQINGERSDDTRSSRAGSLYNEVPTAVPVRCLLRSARVGQPKLQEAHVVVTTDPRRDNSNSNGRQQHEREHLKLTKDDLVLVLSSGAGGGARSVKELLSLPHSLALVLTSAAKNSNRSTQSSRNGADETDSSKHKQQQTLLMLAGSAPPQDTIRWCIPVMGLSTFLREWSALMSIRNHRLMPLAPYLLKGSPVVSSQHLSALHDLITTKLRALEYNSQSLMSEDRRGKLNQALLQDLTQVHALKVDGSVLKNTGIAKTVKNVSTTVSRLISPACEELAASIIAAWKMQVKHDNKSSTIRKLKGGKLIEMPADGNIDRPRCVSPQLWQRFCNLYNVSQLFAIKYVSDQLEGGQDTRIALVQGPPGTGKTFTILGMVSALLHLYSGIPSVQSQDAETTVSVRSVAPPAQRKRLLICAPSNTAVDELLTRLTAGVLDGSGELRMVKIVRLGEPLEGAAQAICRLTLDYQIEERVKLDESWGKLNVAKEQIRNLEREVSSFPRQAEATYDSSGHAGNGGERTLTKEQKRLREVHTELATQRQVKVWAELCLERARNALRQQILLEADIVGTTLSGSGRKQFLDLALNNDVVFDTAIIDEAAQTTEPSCLIPLRLGCRRLVLVGDPRQLPATVLCKAAAHAGLGRSLFERLERADHEVVMLTIQYRMHPEIRQFPSQYFYQNLLTDAQQAKTINLISVPSTSNHRAPHMTAPRETFEEGEVDDSLLELSPVTLLDLRSGGDINVGKSFRNDAEAQLVAQLLCALLPHLRSYSVALIAPYKAQVNRLRNALRDVPELAALQQERRAQDAEIEINSVDGFQGREKDVVIFSAVRSNHRYQSNNNHYGQGGHSIGFVGDERRLNVAITRAKRLLIVVGNAGTLGTDATWSGMIRSLQERRKVRTIDRPESLNKTEILNLLTLN